AFARLEPADAAGTAHYAARRTAVAALQPMVASPSRDKDAGKGAEHDVKRAAEHGDAEQLRQLAEKMLSSQPASGTTAGTATPRTRFEAPSALAEPFPQAG